MIFPDKPGVYALETPSGTQYIGSTVNLRARVRDHFVKLMNQAHKNNRIRDAWRSGGLTARVLLICPRELVRFYEQRLINGLRPRLNISHDAYSAGHIVLTPEHRAKLAAAKRGRPGPWRGKNRSQETKNKLSATLKGRPRTAESIAKQLATCAAKRRALGLPS